MMIIDIRKDDNLMQLKFDDSNNTIMQDINYVYFYSGEDLSDEVRLCRYEDLDNFIAACKKAKELWYKHD